MKYLIIFLFCFSSCGQLEEIEEVIQYKDYVTIIAGQSQANGRALKSDLKEQYPEVYNHSFKTKVWVDGWESLSLDKVQFLNTTNATHGIEVFIAYDFEKKFPNKQLYIIKHSYGGIPLAKDNSSIDWNPHSKDEMFDKFKGILVKALQFDSYKPFHFAWMQGASDAIGTHPEWTEDHQYLKNLAEFFNLVGLDNFKKKIVLTVSDFDYPYIYRVVSDQREYCKSYNADCIETDDLPIKGKTYAEDPHFNTEAYKILIGRIWNI